MLRFKLSTLLFAVVLACLSSASATVTYYVGSCKTGSYATISDALAATIAPDVVKVCPGTYPESILITKPVTLEGISSGGSNQVFITGISTADGDACADLAGEPVQLCVSNTGTVNLINITVDGSGKTGFTGIIGIMYASSSGTINHVEVRFQQGTEGVGVYLVGGTSGPTITFENSNVHSFVGYGILTGGGELTVSITGNTVVGEPGAVEDIGLREGVTSTVTENLISGPALSTSGGCGCVGIMVMGKQTTSISKNTIVGSGADGIQLNSSVGTSVTANTIFDVGGAGIQVIGPSSGGGVIENNIITQAQNGIDFGCQVLTEVQSNTISVIHSNGLANVPPGATSANTYFNVPTISSPGSCP